VTTTLTISEATTNITDYGWFKGNIYNGSQKTIREILIEYKSKKNKYVEYKITGLNIKPLTSVDFLTEVHDKDITKLEWNYTVKGCD
jgi:hypothetical protein